MTAPTSWCARLAPVTAVVTCEGAPHRVAWRRGKLVLEDHDLAAEWALMALGGQPNQCLKVLTMWRQLHSWRIPAEVFRSMQSGPVGRNLLAPPELGPVTELTLALTWHRAWKRSTYLSPHAQLVEEQLRRRARPALASHVAVWRARTGSRMTSAVEVRLARPGRPPSLEGTLDTVGISATAFLDARWLVEVWARGLASVDDGFVLEAAGTGRPGGGVEVVAARWDPTAPGAWAVVARPALAERDAGGAWRLSWDP